MIASVPTDVPHGFTQLSLHTGEPGTTQSRRNDALERAAPVLRAREISGSNLGPLTGYWSTDRVSCGFPQYVHANSGIVHQISPQSFLLFNLVFRRRPV